MPSRNFMESVYESLHENEKVVDVAVMADIMMQLRGALHPTTTVEEEEILVRKILCLIEPSGTQRYRSAIAQWRRLFVGISEDREQQLIFVNSITPATLFLNIDDFTNDSQAKLALIPSNLFSPVPILRWHMKLSQFERITDQRWAQTLKTHLADWF